MIHRLIGTRSKAVAPSPLLLTLSLNTRNISHRRFAPSSMSFSDFGALKRKATSTRG
jgi:hypothetical protein